MIQFKTGADITPYHLSVSKKINRDKYLGSEMVKSKFAQTSSPLKHFGKMKLMYAKSVNTNLENYSKLFIKNMVCSRCKIVVKIELEKMALHCMKVELGEVDILEKITIEQREQLRAVLLRSGLDLISDKKETLIEKIKSILIEMIHYSDELPKIKISYYLSEKLNYDYTYLSNIFSETVGMSIQQFIITHKIERVKELLAYEDLTLSEIAFKLNYSSTAHLSGQFKKITGMIPSHFKKMKYKGLIALDDV